MKKWCLLLGLGFVLACEGSLEESGEEVPQTEDPNASATLPTGATSTTADAAPPPSSDASIGKKDLDGSVEARDGEAGTGAQPMACAGGTAETEPNDSTAKATKVVAGKNCGLVAAGDTDYWALTFDGEGTLEVDGSDDVSFALVDEKGLVAIPIFPGDPIAFNSNGTMFIRVKSTSKESYTLVWE